MSRQIVVIGGVAGGASAAARLRRLDETAQIVLLERGGYISFANCGLPYYLGGVIAERGELLLQTPESMRRRFQVDVRVHAEVTAIEPREKQVAVRNTETGETYRLPYDQLVIAPGAFSVRPPFPGATLPEVFTLRNMEDCDRIKLHLLEVKPRRALVVGGGFIGIEMMENLVHAGVGVVGVELADQVLGPLDFEMASILHRHIEEEGIDLRLGVGLASIEKDEAGRLLCRLSDGAAETVDMVLLSIGVRPENALAKDAGLELEANGAIKVDRRMRTSDPDIYAVGDAVGVQDFITGQRTFVPLAGPANRQGRVAADNLAGRDDFYTGTQGTLACKVFKLTAGATGCNEKQLRRAGIAYDKVYIHPFSHAGYYPKAEILSMKLLYAPDGGKVLGAQAVGKAGVDKRIDVIATAIRANMTVFDLEKLELSYAPPFSSAKDPVNMAGFTAANVLKGDLRQIFIDDLAGPDGGRDFLVDTRTPEEYAEGTIDGAVNIPLDDIRDRLAEFPRDKRIVLFCKIGLRGYLGCRILMQRGFDRVYNLSGGYLTWEAVYGKKQ